MICTDITNAMVVRCIPQKEDILWSEPVECCSWHRLDALVVAILTVHLVYVFNVVDQESFLAVSDGGIWNWDVSFQPKVLCYFIACFYFLWVFFILLLRNWFAKPPQSLFWHIIFMGCLWDMTKLLANFLNWFIVILSSILAFQSMQLQQCYLFHRC